MLILAIAALGALIPTVVYVSIAWWLDRYEKEPWKLMALTFLWGAIPAIFLAGISEVVLTLPLLMFGAGEDTADTNGMPTNTLLVLVAFIAPVVEESLKAIPLLIIFLWYRREFDGLMDGLLYGALVGFGFAMTENFMYIVGTGASAGLAAEAGVFFLRTIVFGMMHALWSSMFGIGLAISRYTQQRSIAYLAPCGGLLLGMLLHMTHNFSAVSFAQGGTRGLVLLAVMFASYGIGCLAWLVLVYVAGRREAAWIRDELQEEVANGVLTAAEAGACGRYRTRVATRWAAMREHGYGYAHKLGHLYSLGADLAFKKRQLKIHPGDATTQQAIREHLAEIRTAREDLAARTGDINASAPITAELVDDDTSTASLPPVQRDP